MKINLTIEISTEEIFSAIRHMDFQEMARLQQNQLNENATGLTGKVAVLPTEEINSEEFAVKLKKGDLLTSEQKSDTPKEKAFNAHNPAGKTAVVTVKKCEGCGNEYQPTGNAQRFCATCKGSHNKKSPIINRKFKERICLKCNKPFIPIGPTQRFCSTDCGLKKKWSKSTRTSKTSETKPTEEPAQNTESYYHKKLAEKKAAKEEAELMESLREHPKIDYKKLHNNNVPSEKIPSMI